ncbi:hypothetical protein [Mucilaginibacter psychrotolerans]|uniref:DUF4136 domain-containing protein n=1 Tax=Mucilaginibacter psychrotolerans TaxID=1524096 RepID=A0A4Y8SIF1_9SPHI|nr:hypothetical protein [Mucilaginibacter psychrotolerans]TFF38430.1 hypothetical protein E2R66_08145 [Mucilaginibacter psychrotolerans]
MKKFLLFIGISVFSIHAFAQFESSKQIYESPKLKDAIKTHKLVAILPFKVTISYKRPPKNFDAAANHDQELKLGKSIQSSMYTYLLRKADNYSVSFQDIEKTMVLLNRAKYTDSLEIHTKDEIAKVLGVDAVIFGTYEQETTKSEAGAIVTTALFGFSKTGEGSITMQIANGSDGELLWRYNKKMNEGLLTSTDDVIERQMRKISRNFPYSK